MDLEEDIISPPYALEDVAPPPGSALSLRVSDFSFDSTYSHGLRLGRAPQLRQGLFVGRDSELKTLSRSLAPGSATRNVVAIAAVGGLGKTQLAITYAERYHRIYSSVFWLDAKDESTLKQELAGLADIVLEQSHLAVGSSFDEDSAIKQVKQWFSFPNNDRWLLILDNYDDPKLPGIKSTTGYDIRSYFPSRSQGSIIITTRSKKLIFAECLELKNLEDIAQGLEILSLRSGQDLAKDPGAIALASRLAGFPLALATAGAYIGQSSGDCTAEEYLGLYDEQWHELQESADQLLEYEDRTLFSTWSLSLEQVRQQHPAAADLMTFLAYLGSSGLNFELFSSARIKAFIYRAEWLNALVGTKTLFNKAMATLHSYSLVEHSAQGYSLHTCVHEWTLQILNKDFRPPYFWDAMMCIAANVRPVTDMEYSAQNNQRILTHATQLWKIQLREPIYEPLVEPNQAYSLRWLSYLWRQHGDNSKAEVLLIHAYGAYEKLLGGHHVLTLEVVVDLADTYEQMDRSAEAEGLYKQVLGHYDHISRPTQENIDSRARHNLALSYRSQHKFNAAEGLLRTALAGEEETLGIGYPSTMQTATSLASVLTRQGKFLEAEALSKRATDELTRTLGPDHPLTLDALNTRGDVHFDQGQWEQAGTVFKLVIAGMQRNSGSIDAKTLRAVRQLGTTYIKGSNLGGLLELATEWGSRDRFVYEQLTKLGRTSLRRGDQKTARIAYANSLYINDGVLLCPQLAYCDLCQLQPKDDDKITLEMGRFICLTCADVDLCRTCYGKYQRAEESVPGCVRHGFFEMPSKRFSDQGKTCP